MTHATGMRPLREDRLYPNLDDQRNRFSRDRDRVMYTDEFRRLAEITQVISPSGYGFHNRLTHTLEVAQIARRIAEYINEKNPETVYDKSENIIGLNKINPDVIEAAALIHDLGHPPFGHVGESTLDKLVVGKGNLDGFEGNAQSFRIVTRLAVHGDEYMGLNLTRGVLNASLKYPNLRSNKPLIGDKEYKRIKKKHKKFGAYRDDIDSFNFARFELEKDRQSLEANIMDYADDIAYSIHDMTDFYKAGMLPLENMLNKDFLNGFFDREKSVFLEDISIEEDVAKEVVENSIELIVGNIHYSGKRDEEIIIKKAASEFISACISNIKISEDGSSLVIGDEQKLKLAFFKRLIWVYVINSSQLATQQRGYRRIVERLFGAYWNCIDDKYESRIIPNRFKVFYDMLEDKRIKGDDDYEMCKARFVCDIVSSFSDRQAIVMYRRLNGIDPGNVNDYI